MQIYLLRHGIAEPREGEADDFDRSLTPRGVERTLSAAMGLARVAPRPEAILSSPKLRAMQTAAILGDVFDLSPRPLNTLADPDPEPTLAALRSMSEDWVMLVGHEPTLSELAARLCFGDGAGRVLEMKKSACALIEAPLSRDDVGSRGILRWLLPPRVLRELGREGP